MEQKSGANEYRRIYCEGSLGGLAQRGLSPVDTVRILCLPRFLQHDGSGDVKFCSFCSFTLDRAGFFTWSHLQPGQKRD